MPLFSRNHAVLFTRTPHAWTIVFISRLSLTNSLACSPRFDVTVREMDRWANNLLPSRQFGYIVLTTSAGIMDHEEARRKHTGGKILGYFY